MPPTLDPASADAEHDVSKYGYVQELDRSMNVWQLTAFGLNYMVPIAPAIIFGILLAVRRHRRPVLTCWPAWPCCSPPSAMR